LNLHHGSGGSNTNNSGERSITPRPMYVMNITDVDDKIIQRSVEKKNEKEADPLALARYYEQEFWQDMDALNVLRPNVICRVSEHVESTIVPYIMQIVNGGMAYVIPEDGDDNVDDDPSLQSQQGSVYFDVRAFESITHGRTKYGKLAPNVASTDFFSWEESSSDDNNNEEEDDGNNGNDGQQKSIRKKRNPRDFCLWKYRSRSQSSTTPTTIEPLSVSYASPWGPGRPGWHVECSAMIQQLAIDFSKTHEFGVHAGGVDLKFPHHSNEIAQAEAFSAASGGYGNGNDKKEKTDGGDGNDFKEWIPHWIHTGHLYVKGRKMSKSLKNFVTIREMLGVSSTSTTSNDGDNSTTTLLDQNNNAWSSPADDFRLWCLGLSGAYRGPATYSKDRMVEARVVREKWIRFLMEGQECLERWNTLSMVDYDDCPGHDNNDDGAAAKANSTSTRLWGDGELQLFHTVTQCSMNCRKALLDDLDGTLFVKELTRIADTGLAYVQEVKMTGNGHSNSNHRPAEEPLRFVLDTLRGQLELVGFTQRTVNAGISSTQNESSSLGQQQPSTNNTSLLLDEAVAFRAAVRSTALGAIRNNKKKKDDSDLDNSAALKEILGLCDELRDDTFPKLGVEILDGKVVANEKNGDEGGGDDANRGWRHCSPRETKMGNS